MTDLAENVLDGISPDATVRIGCNISKPLLFTSGAILNELNTLIFEEGVTSVGCIAQKAVFKNVVLPASLENFNWNMALDNKGLFIDCKIENLTYGPRSLTKSPESALFFDGYGICEVNNINITETVENIPAGLFYKVNYDQIDIAGNVATVGADAFKGYKKAQQVSYTGTLSQWLGIRFSNREANPARDAIDFIVDGQPLPFDLKIPSDITGIEQWTLPLDRTFGSVDIPHSITSIGEGAFNGAKIHSLRLGNGLLRIGKDAFSTPKKTFFMNNSLADGFENAIGERNYASVEDFDNAFSYLNADLTVYPFLSSRFTAGGVVYVPVSPSERTCDAVDCDYSPSTTAISLGSTVSNQGISLKLQSIKDFVAYGNRYLLTAEISHPAEGWGIDMVADCESLETATITSAGDVALNPFKNCPALKSLTVANDGNIGDYTFMDMSPSNSLTVTCSGNIGEQAFLNNHTTDMHIEIGGAIGSCAFLDTHCNNNLYVDCVGKVGDAAFKRLTDGDAGDSITLGSHITELGAGSFARSFYLYGDKKLVIPENITAIGDDAFNGCRIPNLVIEDSDVPLAIGYNTEYNKGLFYACATGGILYLGRNLTYDIRDFISPLSAGGDVTVGDKVTALCDNIFYGSGISTLRLSANLNSIGVRAFQNCILPEEIEFPATMRTVGAHAFDGCESLSRCTLNEGLASLGEYAFGASGITSMSLPESLEAIGDGCFINCDKLSSLTLAGTFARLPKLAFYNCSSLPSVFIPDNVMEIGDEAFAHCSKLASVAGYSNTTLIGNEVFAYCSALGAFEMGDRLASLGKGAFRDCTSLSHVKVGEKLEEIKSEAFLNCSSLASITIPKATSLIGGTAFDGCSALSDLVFDDRVTTLHLGDALRTPFTECPLKTVYIGGPIKYRLGNDGSPFYRNRTLEKVTISDTEVEIYDNEFLGCESLTTVMIGDRVRRIGDSAFSGCQSLETFSFGYGMTEIGADAFSDCTAMTTLTSNVVVPPTCGPQALDDINKWQCRLIVPQGYKDKYEAAPQWKEFFFIEEGDAPDIPAESKITLDRTEIKAGGPMIVKLTPAVSDTDGKEYRITWNSSDNKVATVDDDGTVTVCGEGKATIYAYLYIGDDLVGSADCAVVAVNTIPESLTLDNGNDYDNWYKHKGEEFDVHINGDPDTGFNIKWSYSSSKLDMALTADPNTRRFTVLGDDGYTLISITSPDNSAAKITLYIHMSPMGVDDATAQHPYIAAEGNILRACGISDDTRVAICTVDGLTIYDGCDQKEWTLSPGRIYIIHMAGKTFKVAM